jgi:hypothetical protein
MAQATVGSLNVILGMDAGDFDRAVKQVQGTLDKMAARFAFIGNAVSTSMDMAADAVGEALGAIPAGIRKAIDALDKLDETAQKVGLSVEQLDRFKYVAEATGLSMESFESIASKLSKTMSEIAGGDKSSDAALAFQAIGVSVTDAAGNLKSLDVLLADVAEKFDGYADGAEKTALAVQLFGKSGAALIPTLNEGRDGIQALIAEYNKLPPATAEIAAASAHFNDTITKLAGSIERGFYAAVAKALPFLQQWADWLTEDNRLLNAVQAVASAFTDTIITLVGKLSPLIKNLAGLAVELAKLPLISETARGAFNLLIGTLDKLNDFAIMVSATFRGLVRDIGNFMREQGKVYDVGFTPGTPAAGARGASELQGFEPGTAPGDGSGKPPAPATGGAKAAAEARKAEAEATQLQRDAQAAHNAELQRFNDIRAEGKRIYEETLSPLDQLAAAQQRMNEVNRKGGMLAHEYAAAQQRATLLSLNAYAGMASGIAGNLSKLFGESKAFAIAQAIINTAESVTKTLATYGATPWGLAAAAAAAAAGAAQIATIRNANKGGGGGGSSDTSMAAATAQQTSASQAAPQQSLFVSGISSDQLFTGDMVRGLAERLVDFQKNGGQVVFER